MISEQSLAVIEQPAVEPVTLAQAKVHCGMDHDYHDEDIQRNITAARKWLEKQIDGALITQKLRWTIDTFPKRRGPTNRKRLRNTALVLPRWPVQSVSKVEYITTANATATVDLATTSLRLDDNGKARLVRKDWQAWPETRDTPGAVTIEFFAGFGVDQDDVPEEAKIIILMLVAHWLENREAVGTATGEIALGVTALVDSLRDYEDDDLDLDNVD
jgi:uncharacterized phiE125 gp8 family phage protein